LVFKLLADTLSISEKCGIIGKNVEIYPILYQGEDPENIHIKIFNVAFYVLKVFQYCIIKHFITLKGSFSMSLARDLRKWEKIKIVFGIIFLLTHSEFFTHSQKKRNENNQQKKSKKNP